MFKLFLTIVLNLPLDFAPFSCHFLEPTPPGTEQIFQLHFGIFGMTFSWLGTPVGHGCKICGSVNGCEFYDEWVAGFKMYVYLALRPRNDLIDFFHRIPGGCFQQQKLVADWWLNQPI